MSRPWEIGDEYARWDGYLLEDGRTLRNLVGARTPEELRRAEEHLVEARALTLREHGLPATYDMAGLRSIHHHLFQDVYEWAGDVRTVSIRKGRDGWFAPLDRIVPTMQAVGEQIAQTDNLRSVDSDRIPSTLAQIYNLANQAHPFREGNGRTQREYVTALARESGHHVDWTRVTVGRGDRESENDRASRLAATGDPSALRDMFHRIVTRADRDSFDVAAFEAVRIAQTGRRARRGGHSVAHTPTPQRRTGGHSRDAGTERA
ncbi:Fic/DOC family protein [Cellulosimicrobium cellulans]|uniref:protein adenylyltransferase n=1 Tax=Cellulosimicrobium cellulans TaxID=1710 RepID=A0A4Y4E126_CELCE|nr:Fic family protein [Cellulosimicrobium cellulans]GED11312.1 cell filamentation protein Fic [Cellulosimicrobium cellulans]